MFPFRRQVVAFALGLVAVAGPAAAEWNLPLPPVTGEVSGDFTPLKVAGMPKLHWTVAVKSAGAGERDIHLALDGPGARLRVSARLDDAGNGTWRIDEAEIDLGPWFPAVVPLLPLDFAGLSLAGVLRASGEGTWRDGKPGGRATLSLRDGRFDDPAHKFLLEGIALELAIDDLAARRSPAGQRLTVKGGTYDTITLGASHVSFGLDGDEVRVEQAAVAVFAGELAVGAFSFSGTKPEIAVAASVHGIELAMLLPYLPSAVSEARGRLDGTLELRRDAQGVAIGTGRLVLRAGESAELRFLPSPGFIGGALPPNVTKIYTGLADLEQGKVPMKAEELEVTFTPEGDAQGRTASVHVAGGPVDPRLKAPLDLTVDVRGPLGWLVKFGTDSRIHFR